MLNRYLSGVKESGQRKLTALLEAFPIFFPDRSTWMLIQSRVTVARRKGERFGIGDLLIAAIATQAKGLIWSLDTDFTRLAQLRLVELYTPCE